MIHFALQFFIYRKKANNNVQYTFPTDSYTGCIQKLSRYKGIHVRKMNAVKQFERKEKKDLCMYLLYAIQRFLCSFLLHSTVIATYFIRDEMKRILSTPNFSTKAIEAS